MNIKFTHWLYLLIAVCVLAFSSEVLMPKATRQRSRFRLMSRSAKEGVPPEYILTSAVLGGFRGIFITALWTRAQNMKNESKYYEMIDIYNIITKLQPNHHAAWAFQAWDLAYNVSVEFKYLPDRAFWVFRGINLLRKQGIPNNRNIPGLYYELSWIFHHKLGQETDEAHPFYRRQLAWQMERIFEGPLDSDTQRKYLLEINALPESREKMFADVEFSRAASAVQEKGFDIFADGFRLYSRQYRPKEVEELMSDPILVDQVRKARLWSIGERLRTVVNMDPAVMSRMTDTFGAIDWRVPYAHALYWAHLGYQKWLHSNPGAPSLKYRRIIYFSLIQLVERGQLRYSESRQPYYVPDYRLLSGVIKHMDELIDVFDIWGKKSGNSASLTGVKSGYNYFLINSIFDAYFDGQETLAGDILAKLREIKPADKRYRVPLKTFIKKFIGEHLDSPSTKEANAVLTKFTINSYYHLSLGDMKTYRFHKETVDYFYKNYCLDRWPQEGPRNPGDLDNRNYIPKLEDVRKNALVSILTGDTRRQFNRDMIGRLLSHIRIIDAALWDEVRFEIEKMQMQQQKVIK